MSSERHPDRNERHIKRNNTPDIRRADGRYVRWSWRYKTFQSQCAVTGQWMNITPEMARSWASAGLPIGSHV